MSLAARLARLEVALGAGAATTAGVYLAADGIVRDSDGHAIELPAASDGSLSVILMRGPEPAGSPSPAGHEAPQHRQGQPAAITQAVQDLAIVTGPNNAPFLSSRQNAPR